MSRTIVRRVNDSTVILSKPRGPKGDKGDTGLLDETALALINARLAALEAGVVYVPPSAPANTVLPAITGTLTEGSTLTVSDGTWTNSPTSYARQWKRNGVNIGGATAATYVLVGADVGALISATVTATNEGGSASATASAVEIPEVVAVVTPTALFAGGEDGFWADTSDATKLFSDNGATVQAVTDGGVANWLPVAGTGTLLQYGATEQPVLKTVGGVTSLDFDGAGDYLVIPSLDLTGSTEATMFLVFEQYSIVDSGSVAMWGNVSGPGNGNALGVYVNNTGNGTVGIGYGNGGGNYIFATDPARQDAPRTQIVMIEARPGQTPNYRFYVNGDEHSLTDTAIAGTVAQIFNAASSFQVGLGAAADSHIRVMAAGLIGRVLTDAEKAGITAYCADLAGLTFTPASYSDYPTSYSDSAINTKTQTYVETSPLARLVYTTSATSITVHTRNNIHASYPDFTEIGVFVDGVWNQSIAPGAGVAGFASNVITLPAGVKEVEFVNGLQSNPSGTLMGTFVVSLEANASLTRVTTPTADRAVFVGDSITVGGNADYPTKNGYTARIRTAASVPVAVEGYGAATLTGLAGDGTKRTALVAKLTALTPAKIYLALGTNDYGTNASNAADFQTNYAALLVDINAALPSATVYAQTPLLRSTETANSFGNTLGDYRTAIASAASGKAYVTVVDGTSLLTLGDLADGLHPSTAGHGVLATAVRAATGL